MRCDMRRILACLSLFFFLVPVTYVRGPDPIPDTSQYIGLTPVAFNQKNNEQTKTGRLEFLAGWKLTSQNDGFGGFSSMLIMTDNRLLLLSDNGTLAGFTLDEKNNQAVRPFIAPLPDGPPPPNEFAKKNWDSESLLHDPKTGQYWVGFEHHHSIWRFGRSFARKEAAHFPKEMQNWPDNGGAEAMLRLPDGRFLVFAESARFSKGGFQALIFKDDPAEKDSRPEIFGQRAPKGYQLTDAVMLDEHHASFLYRRFTPIQGVSAIVAIADTRNIQADMVLIPEPIAFLKPPLTIDNMEALAVSKDDNETIIWIASDDNFNPVQESLLLKFRLLPNKEQEKAASQNEKTKANPGFSTLEQE